MTSQQSPQHNTPGHPPHTDPCRETKKDGEMEMVAGGLPLPIPEGPFFDVLSRLSIKDLHRYTCLSQWRDVFINFQDSRKILPQTLQGFFYIGCDCKIRHSHGSDDRDSHGEGDSAREEDDSDDGEDGSGKDEDGDCSVNSNGNSSGSSDRDEDEDGSGNRDYSSSNYGGHVGGNRDDGGGDGSGTDEDGDGSGNSSGGSDKDEDEVGGCHDSACSGNYGFHFFDLLAKSMPVPDDTDTEFSCIRLPAPVCSFDLLCSCNGLLLFGRTPRTEEGSENNHSLGYIVYNPATKQWRTVPKSGWAPPNDEKCDEEFESTFLFFDPSVSSRFLLIQFWHDDDGCLDFTGHGGVHIYKSWTREWSNRSSEWTQFDREGQWRDDLGVTIDSWLGSSFLNGMLHLLVRRMEEGDALIVAIDGEGSIRRTIHWPLAMFEKAVFIGQSQGSLHCISTNFIHGHGSEMYVYVLWDYDAEEWTKEFHGDLSGGEECRREDYEVVAFHPDGNLVYFVDHRRGGLIQYDMRDNCQKDEQVLRLCTLGHNNIRAVTPYVPCFSRSSALSDTNETSESPV